MFMHASIHSKLLLNASTRTHPRATLDHSDGVIAKASRMINGAMLMRIQRALEEFEATSLSRQSDQYYSDEYEAMRRSNYLRHLLNHRVMDDFQAEWRARMARVLKRPVILKHDQQWGVLPLFDYCKFGGQPTPLVSSNPAGSSFQDYHGLVIIKAPEDGLSVTRLHLPATRQFPTQALIGAEIERVFADAGDLILLPSWSDGEMATYGEIGCALLFKLRVADSHAEMGGKN